ncbi:transglycosylase SLT domain-containing protein [Myxococcus sp. K15C18031901]|uniref:lytic transglycosylase domain-containing protein n=1 Tax=Myxococcus dinghuensis TaxID=2906761 RepID=UPI0020A75A0B|nr:transglycosylase SLT domain-containing protein [Myxococcus dinghuensis]MCP3104366.1 transglycosylase SLT domain-containing protein [Myxococcus dinghuensis]
MARKRAQGGFSIPWWAWLAVAVLVPVVLLNAAVSWLGDTHVAPLSLNFMEMKVNALRSYAAHRTSCLLDGHEELEPLIDAAERRHRLPPGLLHALVQVESEGRVHRISPAGAMGPGQLMPTTAAMLGVKDPFDPEPALDASARYLAEQLRRFRDVRLAVAAYNAGPGAVNGRVPRNGETEYYVPKVLAAWERTKPPAPAPRPANVARPVLASVAKSARAPEEAPVATKPSRPARPPVQAKPSEPVRPLASASRPAAAKSPSPVRPGAGAKPVTASRPVTAPAKASPPVRPATGAPSAVASRAGAQTAAPAKASPPVQPSAGAEAPVASHGSARATLPTTASPRARPATGATSAMTSRLGPQTAAR